MNTFGKNLRVTTFGESHGVAIGGVIDGFPSGFKINFEELQKEIDKRSPGSSQLVSQRKESDKPEFLSGLTEDGITLGSPIGFIIRNSDHRSTDYSEVAHKYRPNHADYTYDLKYGLRDYRGGGRASARETANWVVAGALAYQWLQQFGIIISAELTGAGNIDFSQKLSMDLAEKPSEALSLELPDEIKEKISEEISSAKNSGDSVGGTVTCLIQNVPGGIGNPVFDKLHADIAKTMMSINAAKGFEYGIGFSASRLRGSEVLDIFTSLDKKVVTKTNYSGGIQGGISNGMPIYFNVAFKPTPTIMRNVETINDEYDSTVLQMKGRHDPCVAVRAVPVVKALAALVMADFLL
ncbi:MAG: chorismate synthase [Muribaculaceae bacterium]|nr:chorismate synthase [Muribaculaceae bacterium]